MKHIIVTLWFFILFFPALVFGQEESKIKEEIDSMISSHPYRLSFFRFQPLFVITNDYDTNTFNAPVGEEIADYEIDVTPGVNVAVKLGNKAYISLDEDVSFVYHRKIEQLRSIVNFSSLKFLTGSRKFLYSIAGGFSNPRSAAGLEFDVPIRQRRYDLRSDLGYGLRPQTDLTFFVSRDSIQYQDITSLDVSLPAPRDTMTFQYGAGVEQRFGDENFKLTFNGIKGFYKSYGIPKLDPRSFWKLLSGFIFSGSKLVGSAQVGFGRTENFNRQGTFNDFLVNANVDYKLPQVKIGGTFSRSRNLSTLITDSFVLTLEGGPRATVPFSRTVSLTTYGLFGKHDYGDNFFLAYGKITKDDYYKVGTSLNLNLPANFVLSFGPQYLNRQSNLSILTKKRLVLVLNLSLQGS